MNRHSFLRVPFGRGCVKRIGGRLSTPLRTIRCRTESVDAPRLGEGARLRQTVEYGEEARTPRGWMQRRSNATVFGKRSTWPRTGSGCLLLLLPETEPDRELPAQPDHFSAERRLDLFVRQAVRRSGDA